MKSSNRFLRFVYLFALIVAIAVTLSVFLVAVGKIHIRSGYSLESYVSNVSTFYEKIYGERGMIYDADGQIVAQNEKTYDIICYLSKDRMNGDQVAYVDDPLYTSQVLASILDMEQEEIYNYLTSNENLYQTELGNKGRNLSQEIVDQINADPNLHGIGFKESTKRVYPLGSSFAPYLVGFAQSDEEGKLVGKMGVEQYLDSELSGEDGERIYQADKNGYILPGMYEKVIESSDGSSVYLTIDSAIQEGLETAFQETLDLGNVEKIWGAVMEVDTGKILAYGQYPSFDPNEMNIEDYYNYGSQYLYEPGSVFKAFIYATAIDIGVYNGETTYDSSPFCYLSNGTEPYRSYGNNYGCIYNASKREWGYITFDKGLIYSSNVATCTLLTDYVGSKTFEEYLQKFGFFQAVDTDGIVEETGVKQYYYPSEKLSLTYGQGSSVTMLQLLQGYSAIFGNGEMLKPYFVDKVVDENGNITYQGERTVVSTPIKESTAQQLTEIMEKVVSDPGGTGQYYALDEVKVAAKTGTAEIASGGSYGDYDVINSVMLGFPAEDPKIMIYYAYIAPYDYNVYIKQRGDIVGSLIKKILLLRNLDFNEDYAEAISTINTYTMENYVSMDSSSALEKLQETELDVVLIGNGSKIIGQSAKEGESVYSKEKIFLLTDGKDITLPDFSDWTRKEISLYQELSGLNITVEGSGLVYYQSVEADTIVDKNSEIILKLKDLYTDAVNEEIQEVLGEEENTDSEGEE